MQYVGWGTSAASMECSESLVGLLYSMTFGCLCLNGGLIVCCYRYCSYSVDIIASRVGLVGCMPKNFTYCRYPDMTLWPIPWPTLPSWGTGWGRKFILFGETFGHCTNRSPFCLFSWCFGYWCFTKLLCTFLVKLWRHIIFHGTTIQWLGNLLCATFVHCIAILICLSQIFTLDSWTGAVVFVSRLYNSFHCMVN